MLFSSNLFVFLFLPASLILYGLAPRKARNGVLFGVSLLFYAWGSGAFVLLLLLSILTNWALALRIADGEHAERWLHAGIGLNLGLLIVFKYVAFMQESLAWLAAFAGIDLGPAPAIPLPIGISFFSFQAITYLVEVFRRTSAPLQRWVDVGMYISSFPQLIAGPIVRYSRIRDAIRERCTTVDDVFVGGWRFSLGLAKKILVADGLGVVVDRVFGLPVAELGAGVAWLGGVCYALQIYYDFSGYSDMAVGLGRFFGLRLPENFDQPYLARSVREFWRRWHMTLSEFFRDFVYIPLGGSRHGGARTHVNLILVFGLTGLWHGAAAHFLVWGLWHGVFLLIDRRLGEPSTGLQGMPRRVWSLLAIVVGWVIFRATSIDHAASYLGAMFGRGPTAFEFFTLGNLLTTRVLVLLAVAVVFALVPKRLGRVFVSNRAVAVAGRGTISVVLLVLSLTWMAGASFNPFIYFQF